MATYDELRQLFDSSDLLNKIEVAIVIAANGLLSGSPTAASKAWVVKVFSSPRSEAKKALMSVLAANSAATSAQILGASDAAIQTKVDEVVPILVDALAGV